MAAEPFSGPTEHTPVTDHVLSVLVENKAGVLSRIAGLFSRRGFNINSLAVAPASDDERFSRLTIVVDAESAPIEQVVGQLNKLINVVEIRHLTHDVSVEREMLLATLAVDEAGRGDLLRQLAHAGASIIDFSNTKVTVTLSGAPSAVDAFEESLEAHYGPIEVQRTGRVALPRLSTSG
jgi:acetolactate synthase-1/3 small subunit